MFVSLFCPAIGVAGAYMVLLLIGVICLVLITQRALFSDMQKKGSKAYQNARLEKARRKESARLRREYEKRTPEILIWEKKRMRRLLKSRRKKKKKISFMCCPGSPG